jgi:hypothetical protein
MNAKPGFNAYFQSHPNVANAANPGVSPQVPLKPIEIVRLLLATPENKLPYASLAGLCHMTAEPFLAALRELKDTDMIAVTGDSPLDSVIELTARGKQVATMM